MIFPYFLPSLANPLCGGIPMERRLPIRGSLGGPEITVR